MIARVWWKLAYTATPEVAGRWTLCQEARPCRFESCHPHTTIAVPMKPNAAVQPQIRAQREFVGWNCLLGHMRTDT